jgi:hypothetical protein
MLYRARAPCFLGSVSLATGLVLAAALAAISVDVHSTTDCPSGEAVAERLRPLLPERSATNAPADRAEIEATTDEPPAIHLRLRGADGHVIGERSLPAQENCADSAEAVAAIVAAWESAPVTTEAPAPPATVAEVAVPVPPAPRLELAVGASAGAALVGGTAATGTVELAAGLPDRRWQIRLAAGGQTARQLDLGGGTVDWQHTSFAAGVVVRSLHPKWRVSVDAGPTLGWATLAGSGFTPSRTRRSFEYGGTAGLRLARWFGPFALWLEGRANGIVDGQQARATGPDTTITRDLPVIDASVSLGCSGRFSY